MKLLSRLGEPRVMCTSGLIMVCIFLSFYCISVEIRPCGEEVEETSVAIVSVFNGDHDIFEEWVHHHIEEGVSAFFVLDVSTDKPLLVPDHLLRFVNAYSSDESDAVQLRLKQLMDLVNRAGYTWVVHLDINEFVWPDTTWTTIPRVLAALPCGCAGVSIPLRSFGDGKLEEMPLSVRTGFLYRAQIPSTICPGGHADLYNGCSKWAVRATRLQNINIPAFSLTEFECGSRLVMNRYQTLTYKRFLSVGGSRRERLDHDRSNAEVFLEQSVNDVFDDRLKQRVEQRDRVRIYN